MSYLKFYFLFLAILLLLWGLFILGQIGKPTKTSQWIWDVYQKKEAYAQSIDEPKIVLVSGSNALFGIDSAMLSKAFGYPVANTAVNAGVGLLVILMHAKRVIKENDIVILPLEYPLYSYDGKLGTQMIDYLYARTPEMIGKLRLGEKVKLFWHVSVQRLWQGYNSENNSITKGLYGVHNINNMGDQIHTQSERQSPAMRAEVAQHTQNPEKYGNSYDAKALGWQYIQDFVAWSKEKNAKVIFMPSTLMYHSSYVSDKKEKYFYENFANKVKSKGWNYIGKPYDYMYAEEAYFNTNFHLKHGAREKRTKQMIKDLNLSNLFDIFKREEL